MKTGARPAKIQVLLGSILRPQAKWMSKLVKKVETLSKKDTIKKTTETFTRGQLEQQHGIAEASAFIAKG
eukprot:446325-Lingulodinium_polyedra.AAC.1